MVLAQNATGSLGSMCRAGPFGDEYLANLTQMMDFAGLSQLNNDGDGNEQPTAVAFDHSGRRLLVGRQDGSVRVYNFSSGQCLAECLPPKSSRGRGATRRIGHMSRHEGCFCLSQQSLIH